MNRTKLSERILPKYTKGEEIFNMTSHIVGGVLGVVATVLCVIFAATKGNVYGVVGGAIFGATMILFIYNVKYISWFKPKIKSKKKYFRC